MSIQFNALHYKLHCCESRHHSKPHQQIFEVNQIDECIKIAVDMHTCKTCHMHKECAIISHGLELELNDKNHTKPTEHGKITIIEILCNLISFSLHSLVNFIWNKSRKNNCWNIFNSKKSYKLMAFYTKRWTTGKKTTDPVRKPIHHLLANEKCKQTRQ